MRIRRTATVAALVAASAVMSVSSASAASDKVVGTSTAAAKMTFLQTSGDCEEAAADIVYGVLKGSRMHESTIEKEAVKLGVLAKDTAAGSNWWGPNGIDKLFAHYGVKSKVGSHTIQTVEADLKAGDKVIAFVQSDIMWNTLTSAQLSVAYGQPPAGQAWTTGQFTSTDADHALVLDSIDETKSTATVSDTGAGLTYTVPLATFRAAMVASGYSYDIVTGVAK